MTFYAARAETGHGNVQQEFLAFWHDGERKQATSVLVKFPPHENPCGSILDDFIITALRDLHKDARAITLNGVVAFSGDTRQIAMGDGRVGSAAKDGEFWKVYL